MPDEPKLVMCPQCKVKRPSTDFRNLPLDLRCHQCVPQAEAIALYDKNVQAAGKAVAQLFDATKGAIDLGPVEKMLTGFYGSWGGEHAFTEDVVRWIKNLGDNPRTRAAAVSASMKILALHAKADKMKLDEDIARMDDDALQKDINMRLLALMAPGMTEDTKKAAMKYLLGGNGSND